MAFSCESQLKYVSPFQSSNPSFSEPAMTNLGTKGTMVARAPHNFDELSSSTSGNYGFIVPGSFLIRKIVSQIEFYFSNENLSKDYFLLRHIQRNEMGFVSIKLLTSLKKMKRLTWNWQVTLYALHFSKLLELSEDGTKVRRKEPIPESFVNIPLNKTLVAWNTLSCEDSNSSSFLLQEQFLNTISKLFGPFGDIITIRIFRPGKKLPSMVKKATCFYPELLIRWCALVEYEKLKSAQKAFKGLIHKEFCSPGQRIKVISLSALKKTNVVSQKDREKIEEIPKPKWPNKLSEGREDSLPCSSPLEPDSIAVSTASVRQRFFFPPRLMVASRPLKSSGQASKPNSSSIPNEKYPPLRKPFSGPPLTIAAPKSSESELQKPSTSSWENKVSPENLETPKRNGPPSNQSVVQNPESLGPGPNQTFFCKPAGVPPTVIRLPRGPDGTNFTNIRGRGRGNLYGDWAHSTFFGMSSIPRNPEV